MLGAGAAVSLAARRSDRIDALAERINGDGGRAIAIETDVTDEAQANAFVTRTNEELGRLDILVNNAGVMLLGPVVGADTSEWRRMIEVNLLGLLYCTHAALPIMGAQGSGHIVNVSSVAGRFANFGSAVYNLTKFGVNAFSEALRQEVAAANVKVTVIEPGFVATELPGPQHASDGAGRAREDADGGRRASRSGRHRRGDPVLGGRAGARRGQRGAGAAGGPEAVSERR